MRAGNESRNDGKEIESIGRLDRRGFLGGAAGLGAASVLVGASVRAQETRTAIGPSTAPCDDDAIGPLKPQKRRLRAFHVRREAALEHLHAKRVCHQNNGDDDLYADRRGSYSKGLQHDAMGEVVPASYASMIAALKSGEPADFEAILLGNPGGGGPPAGITPVHRMINPQAGLAFDMEGADPHDLLLAPAPAFKSAWQAGEIVENYWMAHLRDVPFRRYATDVLAAAAVADLSALSDFRGPKEGGVVTPQTLFREGFPGCTVGPYLSQFFYLPQPFGAQDIDPRAHTAAPGIDYLCSQAEWLHAQDGHNPPSGVLPGGLVFLRNGRDLGQWVHVDVLFQAYFQAFLALSALGVPANPGNPYNGSASQVPFGTMGGPNVAAVLCEVSTRALKAVWFQKWFVHRRLRPEVMGGRIHVHLTGQKAYDIHPDALGSDGVAEAFSRFGTYFLPMAFPEGSPAHPAYGAGHATVAGACVTVLKALFDCDRAATEFFTPLEPTDDGSTTVPYGGGDVGAMTIEGELNKLGANVAIGRNQAGVHWRTDGTESMRLGEEVAIHVLRDHKGTFNEDYPGFSFRRFDGTPVTV